MYYNYNSNKYKYFMNVLNKNIYFSCILLFYLFKN